jgi:hypothetical protein
MATTIISSISSYEFEPDIITDNGRDGVTAFQFSVVGSFSALNSNFSLDEVLNGVPDQPPGNFRVVRRNMSHIAGDTTDGLYRLQVSAEGGTGDNSLFILETSFQYQKEIVTGLVTQGAETGFPRQFSIQYVLEWLSPTVTITTNSQTESVTAVQERVRELARLTPPQIIRNKPPNQSAIPGQRTSRRIDGPSIDLDITNIVGSSVETAGGLFRVRASAARGQVEQNL